MNDPFDCQTFHELCMDYRGALMTATHNGPQIAYEKLQAYCRGVGSARVERFPAWRPIADLPPEHMDVLIAQAPSPMVWAAYRIEDEWYFPGDDQSFVVTPTHWMPLPDAPGVELNVAVQPTAEAVIAVLGVHWLTGIECDHEAKTDVATCWCGSWRSEPQPNVGAAVQRWIEHVAAQAAAHPTLKTASLADLEAATNLPDVAPKMDERAPTLMEMMARQPRWRHRKTDAIYRLVCCNVRLEWAANAEPHAFYVNEETLQPWVRPEREFFDGRFESIEEPDSAPEGHRP